MVRSLGEMQLAIQVLQAITERRQADPLDIEKLRQLAPHAGHLSVDELACEVIQQAIKQRSRVRRESAG